MLRYCFVFGICLLHFHLAARQTFRVLGLYTGQHDRAHISFVQEANEWLAKMAVENNFIYTPSTDWDMLNTDTLRQYALVLFLDTRPEQEPQRQAFEAYMKNGGAWMGFHFAAFALTPSSYPQNWDWYHNEFLGSGQYKSNTWRPTAAFVKASTEAHPVTTGLPHRWLTAPNEWYRWEKDLRLNPDIHIIYAIDSSSFPLGTGPKAHEIWHSGYYPVVWANRHYRMIYCNMGHNDIDYEGGTGKELSLTFSNKTQGRFVLNAILWLAGRPKYIHPSPGD